MEHRCFPLFSCAALLGLAIACRSSHRPAPESNDPLSVLRTQEAAWNRGDLEGFFEDGYLRSPELVFFSGSEKTSGYDDMLARFRRRYAEDGAEMGVLSFSEQELLPLDATWAVVRGRWHLDFKDKPDAGGLFTLLLRKTGDGWRIVHDHTSVGA